jgi:hypothetical protein
MMSFPLATSSLLASVSLIAVDSPAGGAIADAISCADVLSVAVAVAAVVAVAVAMSRTAFALLSSLLTSATFVALSFVATTSTFVVLTLVATTSTFVPSTLPVDAAIEADFLPSLLRVVLFVPVAMLLCCVIILEMGMK